jgi:hypothetical protein
LHTKDEADGNSAIWPMTGICVCSPY